METDDRPWLVASVHYMYFAAGLFITTGVVTVVVSLCTDPPRDYNIVRTTFMTRHDQRVRKDEHEVIPFFPGSFKVFDVLGGLWGGVGPPDWDKHGTS